MLIPGFSNYSLIDDIVINNTSKKHMTRHCTGGTKEKYKLKNDNKEWKYVARSTVKALCGQLVQLPTTAKEIPFTDGKYFIDTTGVVYSFSKINPCGKILTMYVGSNGYPAVSLTYKGGKKTVELHQLMCVTFIMKNYVQAGLVCLHRDDDKLNYSLDNLSVGTYSKNNKDAYAAGLNPGNGLKKV